VSDRQIFSDDKGNVLFGRAEGDPEIYVDGIWGTSSSGTGMKLNFYTIGFNANGKDVVPGERREVVLRLITSIPSFLAIADHFAKHAEQIKKQIQPPSEVIELMERLEKEAQQKQKKASSTRKKPSARKRTPAKKKTPA
jgi:hypothetical protein